MEPKTFDAIFSIFDDVLTNFLQNFTLAKFETSQIDLQHLDMFARSECSSDIAEEVIQNSFFVKMSMSQTLQLNICDFDKPGFVDVFFELLEFRFSAEELGTSDMQFSDLSGVEYQSHFLYDLNEYRNNKNDQR